MGLYVIAVVGMLAVLANAQDRSYCNFKCDYWPGPHTACLYSSKHLSNQCVKPGRWGLNAAEIKELLNEHNKVRQRVASGREKRGKPGPQPAAKNLGPLKWSSELASIAQAWANQCQNRHDQCKDTKTMNVGQNIAFYPLPVTLTELVTAWADEVRLFNRNHVKSYVFSPKDIIGHYTAMVWAKTTHVGCGVSRYYFKGWDRLFLVCNYGPAGNVLHQQVYETK